MMIKPFDPGILEMRSSCKTLDKCGVLDEALCRPDQFRSHYKIMRT